MNLQQQKLALHSEMKKVILMSREMDVIENELDDACELDARYNELNTIEHKTRLALVESLETIYPDVDSYKAYKGLENLVSNNMTLVEDGAL